MELIRRLAVSLPRKSLLAICKSFWISYLDYEGILLDKVKKGIFKNKLEIDQLKLTLQQQVPEKEHLNKKLYNESIVKYHFVNESIVIKSFSLIK